VVREAKAAIPSAWTRATGHGGSGLRIAEIAGGRYRCPDPWYALHGDVLVRRLSPNNRKIEVDRDLSDILTPRMLDAMGRELANIHLGAGDRSARLRDHLRGLPRRWLLDAARRMAKVTLRDFRGFGGA
jgi:hypothetical protein